MRVRCLTALTFLPPPFCLASSDLKETQIETESELWTARARDSNILIIAHADRGGSSRLVSLPSPQRREGVRGRGVAVIKMSGPDVLFPLRNNFYLGAFQAAINEGTVRNLSDADAVEKDSFVYRSYIALGQHQLVIDEINDAAPTALQAVKLLALYLSGGAQKDKALSGLSEWLSDASVASNPTLLLIAGMIYTHEQNYNEALKYTHVGGTLDLCALNVQIYLKIHRTDYSEKQLKIMQQIDEDHTLTQLANAWVNLSLGGAKVQEAYYIFQELGEKFTWTVMLMNGSAVCQMHMGQFEEAETRLLEALNKDSKDANTLANLIVCSLHLSKPTARYLSQLKISHPNHVLVERASAGEAAFERAVQSVA